MNSKLRYPIRLDDGKIIYTIKDEKELFIMREENIRNKLYSTSAVKKEGSKVGSSYCCYGVELIWGVNLINEGISFKLDSTIFNK